MKRWYMIAAVALIATGVALVALPRGAVWTTTSDEARQELEAGLDAQRKLYFDEALQHFEKALKLDPDFVIAKLFVAQSLDSKADQARRKELFAAVEKAGTTGLSARERYMIAMAKAGQAKDQPKSVAILTEYLAAHPDDPYALLTRGNRAFVAGDWDAASRDYRHLIDIAPNFLLAYNQLGYIAMAQGRFADAETLLKKYRYVAPEQANPHDSLGELYVITGRYREAEAEFEEALRVKPEFCASYLHLVELYLLTSELPRADTVIARAAAEPGCAPMGGEELKRRLATWRAVEAGDWSAAIKANEGGTGGEDGGGYAMLHLAYCRAGQFDKAEAIEARLRGQLEKVSSEMAKAQSGLPALVAYLEGQRLLVQGESAQAVQRFEKADALLNWQGMDRGVFKLFNQSMLVRAQREAGQADAAARTEETLRGVNPAFAADFAAGRGIFASVASR